MTRTLVALLMFALLATVAGGAQCVVRCASPVAPPPCHHHSHGKQNPPSQACAAEMLPGDVRADVAVASLVVVAGAVGVPDVVLTASVVSRPAEPASVFRHTILRI